MKKKIGLFICVFVVGFLFNLDFCQAKQYKAYCKFSNEKYEYNLSFTIDGGEIINMDSCHMYYLGGAEISNCSDYSFESGGKLLNAIPPNCPSSFNIDSSSKQIIWITKYKGEYKWDKDDDDIDEISESSLSICKSFHKDICQTQDEAACVWNDEYGFCNVNDLTYLKCGGSEDIPKILPALTSFAVTLLKVATPILLIVVSLITLVKAVAAQKEDEIKKAQSSLIKKIIASVMIFFVISIVQFVIAKVADDEQDSVTNCLSCFLNNDCEGNTYFKDGYGNCYSAETREKIECNL